MHSDIHDDKVGRVDTPNGDGITRNDALLEHPARELVCALSDLTVADGLAITSDGTFGVADGGGDAGAIGELPKRIGEEVAPSGDLLLSTEGRDGERREERGRLGRVEASAAESEEAGVAEREGARARGRQDAEETGRGGDRTRGGKDVRETRRGGDRTRGRQDVRETGRQGDRTPV